MRFAVAFERLPGAVYPADGGDALAAVAAAALAAETPRRRWPEGEHAAYVYDGESLRRVTLRVRGSGPRAEASEAHGPIPGDVAWTLLASLGEHAGGAR